MSCPQLAAMLNTARHFHKGFVVVVVVVISILLDYSVFWS